MSSARTVAGQWQERVLRDYGTGIKAGWKEVNQERTGAEGES
jgi:hypothetical protein